MIKRLLIILAVKLKKLAFSSEMKKAKKANKVFNIPVISYEVAYSLEFEEDWYWEQYQKGNSVLDSTVLKMHEYMNKHNNLSDYLNETS